MSRHLQKEIENLKRMVLGLGASVEEAVRKATVALEERDADMAREVIESDTVVDDTEVEVEEECLKILALHQPVAVDLRFIVAVLKINNDLERIGDLAVNIAERSVFLAGHPDAKLSFDFTIMADKARNMLKKSLDALVNLSIETAQEVRLSDDEVDAMNREVYIKVQQRIREDVGEMPALIHMLSVSRHLERIADLATNIAEDIIYMIAGEIVRHKAEEYS